MTATVDRRSPDQSTLYCGISDPHPPHDYRGFITTHACPGIHTGCTLPADRRQR